MQTVTLELSPVELQALRAALADYACVTYRRAHELDRLGAYPRLVADQRAHESASCALLGRLPQPKGSYHVG